MPAIIGDDLDKQVVIDLNTVGALAIREDLAARIMKIWVSGVAQTGDGSIVLRRDAVDGPIVWQLEANVAGATRFVIDLNFETSGAPRTRTCVPSAVGLFIDALSVAWTAGSVMILYLDERVES